MTGPAVQRFGEAVLLQGVAVPEISYLINLGIRYRASVDGAGATAGQRELLRVLTAAAEETLACGHADTIATPGLGELVGGVGTADAATVLGVSPRHVRRLARSLDGRRVKGVWSFDRHAVLAYEMQRREET